MSYRSLMRLGGETNLLRRRKDAVASVLQTSLSNRFYSLKLSKYTKVGTTSERRDWKRAVSEAKRVVGYPTSYLSLRYLLSDDVADVVLNMRKLFGSDHPLLKIIKGLMYKDRNNSQAWGLIVLLISKAAGHGNIRDPEMDDEAGVLYSQRVIAEVTEMIRTSHLIHKGLMNIYPNQFEEKDELNDMICGNKTALLSGDYLISISAVQMAALRNSDVIMLMSCAARDQSISEFIGRRDKQNYPLPSIKGEHEALTDWTKRNVLSAGNLLGLACQSTLRLAGHSDQLQGEGYKFGKHLALAWQAFLDLEPFVGTNYIPGSVFNLTSAPVMFHLEKDPSLREEIDKGSETIYDVDYTKVHQILLKGPGIKLTKQLKKHHLQNALDVLNTLEENKARTALSNIIFAMGEL